MNDRPPLGQELPVVAAGTAGVHGVTKTANYAKAAKFRATSQVLR
jgi:hypothetical protein